jgi:hypothetical protein
MNETEHEAHFRVNGNGITNIVRDIYHFQHREDAALQILSQFAGISLDTAYEVINGNAKLESINNGEEVKVVYEEDIPFKKLVTEHREYVQKQIEDQEEYNKKCRENRRRGIDECEDSIDLEVQRRTLIFIDAFTKRISIPIQLK